MEIRKPLCINCKFYGSGRDGQRCLRPIVRSWNPVQGEVVTKLGQPAHRERAKETRGIFRKRLACGPAGAFFEPRASRR